MKIFNSYLGLIISILYSLFIRYCVEFGYLEINSISYLIITPIVVGFIPFFFSEEAFIKSSLKCILFPILSTLLFLFIAVITQIEELMCLIIIGYPYILISIIVSIILRKIKLRKESKKISKNYFPLLLMPFITNGFESKIDKNLTNHLTETSIIINANNEEIWKNLHAVPNLSKFTKTSFINRIGIPKPVKSSYDSIQNIRLGYFDNGMILSEKVIEENYGKKLSFSIDMDQSVIRNSPTIENVIKEKSIHFEQISYELIPINSNKTIVKLSCSYHLNTNLPAYGDFLAQEILLDFEENLLHALKNSLEKN